MAIYPYELEKGSKKHSCPQCGAKKRFRRVVDTATGACLPGYVGRCDRESSCGYEYTWKQYLADNPEARTGQNASFRKDAAKRIAIQNSNWKSGSRTKCKERYPSKTPEYLELTHLLDTLADYEQNSFVSFLLQLFPDDPEDVMHAVKDYLIGTKDGFTVFPTISKVGKVCKAKLIKFDPGTGKRIKDGFSISSLQAKLKKAGRLNENFEADKNVFFGEHLLTKYSSLPIAIVEAEKTAVLASICNACFPSDLVWLASGSKQWIKADRLRRLGRDRTIILYPDADGFEKWQSVASDTRSTGLTVKVSNLIEKHATAAQKANQVDLADYLIDVQKKINRKNGQTPADLETILQERIAIMMFDGGLSEADATPIARHEVGIS